jgi:hypothetical protein
MNRSNDNLDESDGPTLVGVRISAKDPVAQSAKELAGALGGASTAQPVAGVVRDSGKCAATTLRVFLIRRQCKL